MGKTKTAISGCASCKIQRRKCSEECVLAPHFPSDDPDKFAVGVEDYHGTEAVNSMVCEATARAKDTVHGTASRIHQLKKQIAELETQLVATQKEVMNMRSQYDNLAFLLGIGFRGAQPVQYTAEVPSQLIEDIMYDNLVFHDNTGSMDTQRVQYLNEARPQQVGDMMYDNLVFLHGTGSLDIQNVQYGTGSQDAQCFQYPTDAQSQPMEDMLYTEEDSLLSCGTQWDLLNPFHS